MKLGSHRFDTTDEVDAVVVGTGAGAAPLLALLAEAGLRVVALEAGPNLDAARHVPDEIEAAADLNWMGERLSGGADPTAFGPNNSGRGVGGSLLHWGAFAPRPDPRDLRLSEESDEGRSWPVEHAELVGYLTQVEHDIGVSGPADYPWDPDRRYRQPPPSRNASATMMLRACAELGIRATDAPAAVLTRDRHQPSAGLRQSCVNCGSCHQGCRTGAKAGADNTYLPRAVAAGAEIRPDATVHTIERDDRGRVTGVVYRREGRDVRQRCANLIMAAGAVETPRLLLHNEIGNSSGQVGRNFMAHGATQVWGRFDQAMRSYRGYPSAAITEDTVRPDGADFAGGYLIQSLGAMPFTLATTMARGGRWGRELVDQMADYPLLAGVGINAECLPRDDNRLELAAETDELGVPRARILFSQGDNERAIDEHAVKTMTDIVTAGGATSTFALPRTAHTIGTCRMGTDAADAVVDPYGRSFEVPNLLVCDNSVFPSSLIANPALTIMALSLRTAEHFLAGRR